MRAVFSLDVENPHLTNESAHVAPAHTILDLLADSGVTATLFFVATTARQSPELVQRAQADGHEIALHSLDHTELSEQSPEEFRRDTAAGKVILEDICGTSVVGYRAPVFSLTESTRWAPEILSELGFVYSSSVLPGRNPLNGYKGASKSRFEWESGLVEFPAPVMPISGLPYFGGIYFRYLPNALVMALLKREVAADPAWFYCHPYDIDDGDGYFRMSGVSGWANLLLMARRKNTVSKLKALLASPDIEWLPGFVSVISHKPKVVVQGD